MPITWRDELAIDHGKIDQDHNTLIAIINAFEAVAPGPDAAVRLNEILVQLEEYADVHFGREERLQRAAHFPYAPAHAQQHGLLMRNLAGARAEMAAVASAKDLAAFRGHMCGFLNDWLLDHIIHNDLLMKPYVRAMAPHAALIGSLHAAVKAMAG